MGTQKTSAKGAKKPGSKLTAIKNAIFGANGQQKKKAPAQAAPSSKNAHPAKKGAAPAGKGHLSHSGKKQDSHSKPGAHGHAPGKAQPAGKPAHSSGKETAGKQAKDSKGHHHPAAVSGKGTHAAHAQEHPVAKKGAAQPGVHAKASTGKGKGAGSAASKAAGAGADSAEAVCREVACEGLATTAGYCRLHYIKNWKKIKRKELILKEGKLNQYIEELVAKYPDKYIEAIRQDLGNDKDFAKVIYDLDLDESVDDFDVEGENIDAVIDTIKRDFDDDGDTGF